MGKVTDTAFVNHRSSLVPSIHTLLLWALLFKVVVNTECPMHEFSKMLFGINFHWNILPHMMEWKGVSRQISPYFDIWKLSSLTLSLMAKLNNCIFRQTRMHKFFIFLPQRVWHLVTVIGRKEMYGVSRQSKIPYISNHFARCGHKGELWSVFSAIHYLKLPFSYT